MNSNKNTKLNLNWLLWWRVSNEELQYQLQNYSTLKPWQSAKGIGALFLTLSMVINILFVLSGTASQLVLLDATLFGVLAYFIYYKSAKWAMIGAMILWTFEKFYALLFSIDPTIIKLSNNSNIIGLIWWLIYMHAFYLAYKVETVREQQTTTPQQSTQPPSMN